MKKYSIYIVLVVVLILMSISVCFVFSSSKSNKEEKIDEKKIISDIYEYLKVNGKENTYYSFTDDCEVDNEVSEVCGNSLKDKIAGINYVKEANFYVNDAKEVFILNLIYINDQIYYIKNGEVLILDKNLDYEIYNKELEKVQNYIKSSGYGEYIQNDIVELSDGSHWYVYDSSSNQYDKYITLINKDNIKEPWDLTGNLKYNPEERTNIAYKIENYFKKVEYKDVKLVRLLSKGDFDEVRNHLDFETSTLRTIFNDVDSKTNCIWVNGTDISEEYPNKLLAYTIGEFGGKNDIYLKAFAPDHICIVKLVMSLSKENIANKLN